LSCLFGKLFFCERKLPIFYYNNSNSNNNPWYEKASCFVLLLNAFITSLILRPDFFVDCSNLVRIDGGFRRHNSQPSQINKSYPNNYQMSSTEEVLRSLSYQHHLVAVTKNFYYQRYDNNGGMESRSSSSTSSPIAVPVLAHSPRHVYLSPGPAFSRPCRSLPESRRTSFASVSYPSIGHISGSYSNVVINNTLAAQRLSGRPDYSYRGRSTSKIRLVKSYFLFTVKHPYPMVSALLTQYMFVLSQTNKGL